MMLGIEKLLNIEKAYKAMIEKEERMTTDVDQRFQKVEAAIEELKGQYLAIAATVNSLTTPETKTFTTTAVDVE
jgi:hypothetical protein